MAAMNVGRTLEALKDEHWEYDDARRAVESAYGLYRKSVDVARTVEDEQGWLMLMESRLIDVFRLIDGTDATDERIVALAGALTTTRLRIAALAAGEELFA